MRLVGRSNNLHILFCLNYSSLFTNLKYVPNNKVPISLAQLLQKELAYLDIFILLITNHYLDKEVSGPRWDGLLANVLDQLAHLHRHSVSSLNISNCP